MASIEIQNASVSYFLRKKGDGKKSIERGAVGAEIIVRQRHLEIAALQNITLSLRDGDRVGIVGINGSGKSTLLKLCAGALSTQAGSITIEGSVSPQFSLGAGLKATLSGRRNTELRCLYVGTPQRTIAERVEEVKELSGLGGYFELPLSTYSAGMRSRLVMSLMRVARGDILIMDEWINTADASVNKKIGDLQRTLIESSSILLLASHNEKVLSQWTDTLVWLEQGQVRDVGPHETVFPQYENWTAKARGK